jgi:hypothetical protein
MASKSCGEDSKFERKNFSPASYLLAFIGVTKRKPALLAEEVELRHRGLDLHEGVALHA